MKFPLLVLLLLPFSATAAAQTEIPIVRWSPELPNADYVVSNGLSVKILTFDKASIGVSLVEEHLGTDEIFAEKFLVYATVINGSNRRIEIVPDDFYVEAIKPKSRQLNRVKAAYVAGLIKQWLNMKSASRQMATNSKTVEARALKSGPETEITDPDTPGTYSRSSYSTTNLPDLQPRELAAAETDALNQAARQARGDLVSLELKANTVIPQSFYSGILIFDWERKCKEAVVRVRIDGQLIEFPFTLERK